MKGFSPQKVDRKLVFLARTLLADTYKEFHIHWPLVRSCVTQSCSYILSRFCSGMLLVSIFFAARCWQIWSKQRYLMSSKLYILQHQAKRWSGGLFGSDRQWIIFRNTVGKVLVMRMLRFRLSPNWKLRPVWVDRSSKASKPYKIILQSP